jgi:hypothetical protein
MSYPTDKAKPITLTIIPQSLHPNISINKNNHVPIPNFNHSPIVPTIIPSFKSNNPTGHMITNVNQSLQMTDQEKIEKHRQSNREYQKKFRNKTKGFTEITHLPSVNERIKHVWLLTYPNINIEEQTMDVLIAQFVNSMLSSVRY